MSTKIKARFNGIDLLLIIIFIGCIAGLVLRFQLVDAIRSNSSSQEVEIKFYVSNIQESSINNFSDGDKFYITEKNEYVGKLNGEILSYNAKVYNLTTGGEYVVSEIPHRCDVRGTITANGTYSEETGFLLNNTTHLAPGNDISISSSKIEVNVTILEITPVSTEE